MSLKLSILSIGVVISSLHIASAYTDLGSKTEYWSNISGQDDSFLINGGTIWLDGSSGRIDSAYSFIIGGQGAYFNADYSSTFEGVVFSNQGTRGEINISAMGTNMYLTRCTIDVGSISLNGNGSNYIVFDTSSINLGFNEQISANSSLSQLMFRFGSLTLDLDSYVQAIDGAAASGSWNLISSASIDWDDMTINSASDSFIKDSETLYHYTDTNGNWLVNVDGQGVTLSYSSFIPEPSHFALLLSGFAFTFMVCRRKKQNLS